MQQNEVFKKTMDMMTAKATESNLAVYFDKLSTSLQKECGVKPFKNKLDQANL